MLTYFIFKFLAALAVILSAVSLVDIYRGNVVVNGGKSATALKVLLRMATIIFLGSYLFGDLAGSQKQSFEKADNLPAFVTADADAANQPESPEFPVIRLHRVNPKDGSGFYCSAFVVSNAYAVTAGHCIEGTSGMTKAKIAIYNRELKDTGVVAKAAAINRRGDVGLITGDFSKFRKIRILVSAQEYNNVIQGLTGPGPYAEQMKMMGQPRFIACGYPYGDAMMCSGVRPAGLSTFMIMGSALVFPGMSGGPLIDQDYGIAVGVNSFATDGVNGFGSLISIIASFEIEVK